MDSLGQDSRVVKILKCSAASMVESLDASPSEHDVCFSALVESHRTRMLEMTDIAFSNSLIESWWRVLKHHWLFLNTLDSASTVIKVVEFYVTQHNSRPPHSAFRGQAPDEMCFGTGEHVPGELEGQMFRPALTP